MFLYMIKPSSLIAFFLNLCKRQNARSQINLSAAQSRRLLQQSTGRSFDHGINGSSCDCSIFPFSSSSFGNSVSKCLMQQYTFSLLALAVSVMLQMIALACAPRTVLMVIQFLRPRVKFLNARSLAELSIGISPSVRNSFRYDSWFIL